MKKATRIAGFVGALGASALLVGFAGQSTGAYFTDSHAGTIAANAGHLTLDVSNTTLNFADLMPGTDQTQNIDYRTHVSSGKVDIWLVFPTTTDPSGYQAWTGPKANSEGGGLGRYGHFAVANNNNIDFQSYNLQLATDGTGCPVNQNGDGNFPQKATSVSDTPPECGVPAEILLASNVPDNTAGQIEMTYGLSGRQKQQGQIEPTVPFNIVATQAGIRPDAPNF